MGKIKNLLIDVEEKVFGTDLEEIITESDTVQEAQNKVLSFIGYELTAYEIDIAKDVVSNSWNEYWSDYAY